MTRLRFLSLALCLGLLAGCLPGPGAKPVGQGGGQITSQITGPAVTTTALPEPGPMIAPRTPPKTRYGSGPLVPTVPGPLPMPKPAAPAPVVVPAPVAAPEPAVQPVPKVTTDPAKTPIETPTDTTATPAVPNLEKAQPTAVVEDDPMALKCRKKGGQWANVGETTFKACVLPTRDGGKQCRAKTDCQGECLARSGSCSPIAPLFGCNEILTEGGLRVTQCIE